MLVTCLVLAPDFNDPNYIGPGRTFIQVVGISLDSRAAEEARNTVRAIAKSPPS